MTQKNLPHIRAHVVKANNQMIHKQSNTSAQITQQNDGTPSKWLQPSSPLPGLKAYVTHSSILPQCIRAYKNNIAGFGIGVRYKEDYEEETAEMKKEFEQAEQIMQLMNMDMDTKEIFEDVIEAREIYGVAYLEVLRNLDGQVNGIEFIKDTPSMRKTIPLAPHIDVAYHLNDHVETRAKKFCKYQQRVGTQTVYFKEIGDPRVMDKRTGEYLESLGMEYQANEILEFAIGTEPYGEVRWIGQVLGVDGSRKAESLNNRYFEEGRHTPLMIMIKGGTLTEDSLQKLQGYMDGIKGESGQHAFMILETENADNKVEFTEEKAPNIEIKELASILQKDELFQDYLDNNRRKVQSAFQLPDLYVGYTTDFNRATAQTAMEVTEKQVFQPERKSFAWMINQKLLAGYQFKYVEAYFLEPDIANPDDLAKILNVTERAGGLTPNKAKEITFALLGEMSEDYQEPWGNTPLQYFRSVTTSAPEAEGIQKSHEWHSDELVAVMKEMRTLLKRVKHDV